MVLKYIKRVIKKAFSSSFIFIITPVSVVGVFNRATFTNSDDVLTSINGIFTPAVITISPTLYYYIDIIIKSDAQFNQSPGFGFKGYKYAIVVIKLEINDEIYRFCLNIGCIISFINRKFLYKIKLKIKIFTMSTFIEMIDVSKIKYFIINYVILDLYFPAINSRLI